MHPPTIDHAQFAELVTALRACSEGLFEGRAVQLEHDIAEKLLEDLRVPKCERYMGRLKSIDLGAIRSQDFNQALATLQHLARLPIAA